jgi:hypothetical protein
MVAPEGCAVGVALARSRLGNDTPAAHVLLSKCCHCQNLVSSDRQGARQMQRLTEGWEIARVCALEGFVAHWRSSRSGITRRTLLRLRRGAPECRLDEQWPPHSLAEERTHV